MPMFKTQMVCARYINYEIEDGKVHNVQFLGGCDGNLKAIGKLIEGMPVERVVELLEGNDCNGRGTSCADQLTRALKAEIA